MQSNAVMVARRRVEPRLQSLNIIRVDRLAHAQLERLDRELRYAEEHVLPVLRLGPTDVPPGVKAIPVARLERIPKDDPERLREGARYFEQLAREIRDRETDRHYQ
jgi:hypothetical protein